MPQVFRKPFPSRKSICGWSSSLRLLRVGIPREVLSDQGTQFTSQLMAELHKLLGVKPSFTTSYHPSANERVERLHGPLKASLRKLCVEKPRKSHRYLIPALFTLREIPSDQTGFSAFELLYGRLCFQTFRRTATFKTTTGPPSSVTGQAVWICKDCRPECWRKCLTL